MGTEKRPTVGSSEEYWSIKKIELVFCGNERFFES